MTPTNADTANEYAFPLSFAQERLWFLDQLVGSSPMYNLSAATHLRMAVDAVALRRAVNVLVERHESLRTVFRVVGGEPRQVVVSGVRVPLEAHDLRRLPPGERAATATRLAGEFAVRPFDLARGPLLRTALVWLEELEFVLLVGVHHVVADGWSMGVFSRELGAVYGDVVSGGDGGVLGELGVQYADFAVWQRERLSGEWLAGELGWWRQELAGLSGLALPTDRARPAVQGHRGEGFGFVVSGEVVGRLGVVARGSSATLFMVGLAAWAVVLGRWCAQDEVVVGAPVAGRDRAELEGLIGFFVNTLVMRVDVSGDPSFVELVGRVREVALGALAHGEVPFEKLVEELAPQRDLSRNPLFQVTFQLFDSPAGGSAGGSAGGVAGVGGADALEIPVTSSLFDVRVDLWPAGSGWSGRVEFDTDLFERSSIEALIDRFVWLLDQVGREPDRPIGSWALLPDHHRDLLTAWNATTAPTRPITVLDAIDDQTAAHPQRPAVSDDNGSWTYAELDLHAQRITRHLRRRWPAGLETVAVCVPRGRHFVAAALGIMRAGAAYLPLDPTYPPARLSHIITHAAPTAMITTSELAARLTTSDHTHLITLDDLTHHHHHHDHDDHDDHGDGDAVEVTGHDLAYVIYTSGSTGEPKGVEIEHHSLINLIDWHTTTYHVQPDDRAAQIASVGFDAAVWEIWPYLATGASIHTAHDHTRADPTTLIEWLDTHQITIAFVPTPLAETLLDHPWPTTSPLRYLLTGGDTLHHHPNPNHPYTLINHYGPTETTVVATATPTTGITPTNQPPTIGHPITNTTCTIIDHAGQPAGPGQPGELHISGPSLARGYHHDPHLTHQRFTTNPHTNTRAYHTGDLTRWNHDGTITFLGRTDQQLKIRGHRIEPTELETIITTHPNITHTTITTHPHPTTNTPQLCAYITTTPHTNTDALARHVDAWRRLYDRTYDTAPPDEPDFDIRGWNASDTGDPLGADVMREQVDQTVERISALGPRTILEIGCGTGLLTHRLAGRCDRYVGTDFSPVALHRLRHQLDREGWRHVELLPLEATDLDGIDGTFDVVVLNSVVQYFPALGYLEQVIDAIIGKVAPHGAIFLGDLRNRALLEVFHTDVELARGAAPSLAQRVAQRIANEQELLIDPGWFGELAATRPRISQVRAEPRRGRHDSELTRYRYDVTLMFDQPQDEFTGPWSDWEDEGLDPSTLVERLARATAPIGVRGVPSARLVRHVEAARLLADGDHQTAGAIAAELDRRSPTGVDPESLWGLDSVTVEVAWHAGGATGRYDVIAAPVGSPRQRPPAGTLDGRAPANEPVDPRSPLVADIRAWLSEQLPEPLVPTYIVHLDRVPLTPNGKVDLAALPDPVPASLAPVDVDSEPWDERESALAGAWRDTLGLQHVGRDDNFFEVGGDSILAIKLITRAAAAGLHFSTSDVFQHQTIAELARVACTSPRVTAEQGPIVGPVGLTPVQRWFLGLGLEDAHHFNQAASIALPRGVDPRFVVRALRAVVDHHDALRLRLDQHGDDDAEIVFDPPGGELKVLTADLSASSTTPLADRIARAATRVQASVSLDGGALRAALIELGPLLPRRLLVSVHHLAVDAVSWRIILEDLWTAYELLVTGRPALLGRKTTSFREWAQRLRDHAVAAQTVAEVRFWRDQLADGPAPLPVDRPAGANTVGSSTTMRVELSSAQTDVLLHHVLAERGVEINDLLIAAAAGAVADWCRTAQVSLAVEGHGREAIFDDVDLTRTVGWFTTIFPLRLAVPATGDAGERLAAVARQLDEVPRRGIGYGLLRYLSPDPEVRSSLSDGCWPSISFNYLGRLDTAGAASADALGQVTGDDRSPLGQRPYLVDLNGAVSDGRLWFDVHYSTEQFDRGTIGRLADRLIGNVRSFAEVAPPPTYVPSGVVDRDVAAVLARIDGADREP